MYPQTTPYAGSDGGVTPSGTAIAALVIAVATAVSLIGLGVAWGCSDRVCRARRSDD